MKNLFYLLLLFCFLLGCEEKRTKSDKLRIVVTTGMIADVVKNIGGICVDVQSLMGSGVDPHLYKATANDTKKLAAADLIVYNGLHLEGKMAGILGKMKQQKAVFAISEDIPENKLITPKGFNGLHDPHIWFDVSLWKEATKKVSRILQNIDSKNSKTYRKNANIYLEKLKNLHLWVLNEAKTIPKKKRILVTAHDAFGYFGKAYGFRVIGLQGISTVTESGIQDIERIVKTIVDEKIKAIFEETSVIKKGVEAVIEHCHELGHQVKIGGSLFSDAMGKEGTIEGTYIGMVKHNVNAIVSTLVSKKEKK